MPSYKLIQIIGLTSLLILLLMGCAPNQQQDQPASSAEEVDESELEYAQAYAEQMDVDLVEADRRLQLETSVEGLYERLTEQEGDTFGGLWIEHEPEYRIVVLFTRDGEETIRPYIEGGPLGNDIEVRPAKATYVELLAAQEQVLPLLGKLEPVVSISMNTPKNRVDLGVTNCAKFDVALEGANETLPDHVTVLDLTFSSCDNTEGSSVAADIEDIEDPLSGTRWQLLAFADGTLTEQPEMWVEFKNGGLSIEGGCNSVGGSYELNDEQITMGLSKTTGVDCSQEKPGANEIESEFFTALRTFESYTISDDELRIRYADGELLLRRLVD